MCRLVLVETRKLPHNGVVIIIIVIIIIIIIIVNAIIICRLVLVETRKLPHNGVVWRALALCGALTATS